MTSTAAARALVRPLEGQIALVTGASRGIGKGIALQLGRAGATVYITGRQPAKALSATEGALPTLEQTAKELSQHGGEAIPVYCDHANSNDVRKLFEQIERETQGAGLDILVNSAYSGVPGLVAQAGKAFWELDDPVHAWDDVNEVGLRNVFICCAYAARAMARRGTGLIVNISSAGGLQYLFSVPYGVGKAAIDRMSADMGHELRSKGVTVVSLWPGPVRTELAEQGLRSGELARAMKMPQAVLEAAMRSAESPEFVGKAIVGLAADKQKLKKSGRIHITADLAKEYRFSDEKGLVPGNMRSVRSMLEFFGWLRLARLVPAFIRVPKPFIHFGSYKF